MLELNTIAATDTAFIHLTHPATGESLMDGDVKVGVTVWGRASKKFQTALSKSTKKDQISRVKNKSVEAQQEDSAVFLADITLSVVGLALDGVLVDNAAMYGKLYTNKGYFWLVDQVNAGLAEDSNFIQR
jgi:hypothetical protein